MRRLVIIKLLLLLYLPLTALAVLDADQTGDGDVTGPDFAMFADNWLGDSGDPNSNYDPNSDFNSDGYIDCLDLAILSYEWVWSACQGASPPDANENISAYIVRSTDAYIYLEAIDEGEPNVPGYLTWQIISLPSYSLLYDPNGSDLDCSDPNSNDPRVVPIVSVPHTLAGSRVLYHSDPCSPGIETFDWLVTDGGSSPCGGSSGGTVTVQNNGPPHAEDACAVVTAYVTEYLMLSATDNGMPVPPGRLTYIITGLPDVGDLYDPASGAGIIDACDLPYTLSNAANFVKYTSDTAGSTSFTWIANDGGSWPSGGDSDTATYSITIDANPADCLSFNGAGWLTIPEDPCDPCCFDLIDGNAIALFFKTDRPFGWLMSKRDGGPGYELYISSGRVKLLLYDDSGLAATMRSNVRVDLGSWISCIFGYTNSRLDPNDPNTDVEWRMSLWDYQGATDAWQSEQQTLQSDETFGDIYNAVDVTLGYGTRSYRGEIDRIRFYADIDVEGIPFVATALEDRTASGEGLFTEMPSVRFMCDEGTGTTIMDDRHYIWGLLNGVSVDYLDATISDPNDVLWRPWNWPHNDSAVPMHYYRRR